MYRLFCLAFVRQLPNLSYFIAFFAVYIILKVSNRVIFFCTQCFDKVLAALSTYSLSEKHTMLDNRLSTVVRKLNELKQDLSEQISKCHAILTSEGKINGAEASFNSTSDLSGTISTRVSTTDIVDEYLYRERHKLERISYGLPESLGSIVDECFG